MLSGAHGFVEKSATLDTLKEAMQTVSDGGTCFGKDNAKILEETLEKAKASRGNEVLTTRKRDTLQLIAEGLSTRKIAEKMDIIVKTAENHRTNMMRKLDLHNATALTRYAVNMGMVENTPVFDLRSNQETASRSSQRLTNKSISKGCDPINFVL